MVEEDENSYLDMTSFLPTEKMRPGRMLRDSFKHVDELAVGQEFFDAIGLNVQNLSANLSDPPDLIYIEGKKKIGIENVGLGVSQGEMDSKLLHAGKLAEMYRSTQNENKKINCKTQFDDAISTLRSCEWWEHDYFLERLRATIRAKEERETIVEATARFDELWLFINVYGANLLQTYVAPYLEGEFFNSKLFSQIWLKLEYDPTTRAHPIYKLTL
jgi:hypothetical protein